MTVFTILHPRVTPDSNARAGVADWQLVALDGEIDVFTAPTLVSMLATSALLDAGLCGVVIDLARLEFIDSAGLGTLATMREELKSSGRDLVLRNPAPIVVRMLDLFGLAGMLEGADLRPTGCRPC